MARSSTPTTAVQKRGHARARNLRRDVIASIIHAADDAGISRRALCTTAGVGPNTLTALERDDRQPTLEVLSRLAAALGGELSVRFHAGTGPSIRDHLQAAMTECLARSLHKRWRVELEVSVFAPTRGVIDVVLRDGAGTVIACEAQSEVRRLEQVIRWARIKSEALAPSGPGEPASRMLLLRASPSTRSVVARNAAILRAAYPVGHRDALAALVSGSAWPGSAIVWMDVQGGSARLRDRVPRGVPIW